MKKRIIKIPFEESSEDIQVNILLLTKWTIKMIREVPIVWRRIDDLDEVKRLTFLAFLSQDVTYPSVWILHLCGLNVSVLKR